MLKQDYGFNEAFNSSYKIDNRPNKLCENKSRTSKINTKNALLNYLRIIEDGIIDQHVFILLKLPTTKPMCMIN